MMIYKRSIWFRSILMAFLLMSPAIAGPAWSQGRRVAQTGRDMQQRDPLAFLKRALANAGAAALDSNQEMELSTLIANFLKANRPGKPDDAIQAARTAYRSAYALADLSYGLAF